MLTYNWQIEGQQEFKEEPFEALVAKLTRQMNAYKKKYKQLSKAVTSGKTLVTSEGTKIVPIPKAALIDTGATKSCMSETFFNSLPSRTLRTYSEL